jgi:hypothetical protein
VLGAGGNRWIAVYAVNGAIQTSGLAEKQDVTECDLGSEFILGLKPVSYRWRSEPEPEEGTLMYGLIGHRKHYGVVAEQVREALGNREFGGLYEPVAEGHWGLCYAELVAPLIKTIQEMDERIKQLEARIAELS